jgi:NADH dehydrogenase (ubiquinone) 1 alpha subcomplex subunit 8
MSNPDNSPVFTRGTYSQPADKGFPELGVTSAPLTSAAFFIGSFCKEYNEDFMLCKAESADPRHCLKEGRKVTRCALDLYVGLPYITTFKTHMSRNVLRDSGRYENHTISFF